MGVGVRLGSKMSSSYYDAAPPSNPNPDPTNFKILDHYQAGDYLVLKVNYPDCTNYEGNKILLYYKANPFQLLNQRSLDPHFSNNKVYTSPIARFIPTDDGWYMACQLADSLSLQK